MELTDLHVGKQLQVASNLPGGLPGLPNIAHGFGPTAIPGAVWADGSLHVGSPIFLPAETCVGFTRPPVTNVRAAAVKSILSITSRGFVPTPIDVIVGDPSGPVGVSVNSILINIISPITNGVGLLNWIGTKTFTGVKAQTGVEVRAGAVADVGKESTIGNVVESGARVINGALLVNGATHINGFLSFNSSIVGTTKLFDIKHPTKKGHRLRHSCIEGPEHAVYHRGRLIDNTVIELPEYWHGLVDPETITVNLTSHGVYQELFVKNIEWGSRIHIGNNLGGPINCSYTVYAERIDVADLEIEYESEEVIPQDLGGK